MKRTGIYKIMNIINNKVYVGSSVNIYSRWNCHKKLLLTNTHYNKRLQNSVNKHGFDKFVFIIIEECDRSSLICREQHWIDELKAYICGYNGRPIANSPLGTKLSEERKKIIGIFHKNRKREPRSEETKKKLSEANKGKIGYWKGRLMPEKTKQKISNSKKGKPSNRKGAHHSEESKLKMSNLRKGIKWNPNYIKPSEETKLKISQTMIKNGTGGNPKKCEINDVEYNSAKEASVKLNINYSKVIERIKSKNFEKWKFIV